MNKLPTILSILIFGLFACREPNPPSENIPDQTLISGEVTMAVKKDITLPPVAFKPDIEALRFAGDTAAVRIVAFGGSLSAGSRNNGLYREGQLTSIPVLIAHQMQLPSFKSSLFDKEEGNGSGYLIYDRSAPLPSWKQVINNLGIVSKNPLVLSKYKGIEVDNISWPEGPGSISDSTNAVYHYPKRREYYSYLYRFFNKKGSLDRPFNYFVDSTSKKTNLILHFEDLDLWVGMATYSKNLISGMQSMLNEGYFYPKQFFILDNLKKGRKMVLYNQPDYLDFPLFHLYDVKTLIAKNNTTGIALEDSVLLIPSDNIKKAFLSKGAPLTNLQDQDVLSVSEIKALRTAMNFMLNQNTTADFARLYSLPMVDMYALYKKIMNRKYYTDDGLFIDPSFPDGNFFSDDGIHPTAIGSAVIANETIKEMNRVYKTRIPLINIAEFAKRL